MFTVNLNHFRLVIDKAFIAEQILTALNQYGKNRIKLNNDWVLNITDNKIDDIDCQGSHFIIESSHLYHLSKGEKKMSISGQFTAKSSIKLPPLINENYKPLFELLEITWKNTNLHLLRWFNINPRVLLRLGQKRIKNSITSGVNRLISKQYNLLFERFAQPMMYGTFKIDKFENITFHYSLVGFALGRMVSRGKEFEIKAYGRALINDSPFKDNEEFSRFDVRRIAQALVGNPTQNQDAKVEFIFNKRTLSRFIQLNVTSFAPKDLGFEISNITLMKFVPDVQAAILISGKQSGTLELSFKPEFDIENQRFDIEDIDILSRLDSNFANFLVNNFTGTVVKKIEDYFPVKIDEILTGITNQIRSTFNDYPALDLDMNDFRLSKVALEPDQLKIEMSSFVEFKVLSKRQLQVEY